MNLLQMPDDVESVRECSRTVRTAEMTDSSALVTHVTHKRMLDLVPGTVYKLGNIFNQNDELLLSITFGIGTNVVTVHQMLLHVEV